MSEIFSAEQLAIMENLTDRFPQLKACAGSISGAYRLIKDCYDNGGKVLLCGNGGSCADAEHIAGELMKGFLKKRPLGDAIRRALCDMGENGRRLADALQCGLPAIPLNVPALSTAVINDLGGDLAFAQQVVALGAPGDVLIGITTSGNAANVNNAAMTARALGMRVVGLTGRGGGALARNADVLIGVDETETYKIQELHLPAYHALCALLEAAYYER